MHPEGLLRWYAEDARFRFANQPPAVGKPVIRALLDGFCGPIRSMSHHGTGCWGGPGSGVWEAEGTFVTRAGGEHTLPAVSVRRVQDGLLRDFRFVMDAAPLQGG